MNTTNDSNRFADVLKQIGYGKIAFIISIVVFLSITFPGLVMIIYGGAKLAPPFLSPVIGVCFFLFYSLIPIGTILAFTNFNLRGVINRFSVLALVINALAGTLCYSLYVLYD